MIIMKYELHCHSWYSKGSKIPWEGIPSPKYIAVTMKKMGFGGFALTDHNTAAGWGEAAGAAKKQGIVFIPGMEISTGSGHLIGLGLNEPIRPGLGLDETIEKIREQGGVSVAPHPLDMRSEGLGDRFVKADAVEVFNSLNLTRVENMVISKKARSLGKPSVGGSDAHCLEMLGMTSNHMEADDMDSALRCIRNGSVKVEGRYVPVPVVVAWTRKRMRLSHADIRRYIDRNYSFPRAGIARFLLERFVRSESGVWNGLGSFAVGMSTVYSALRISVR